MGTIRLRWRKRLCQAAVQAQFATKEKLNAQDARHGVDVAYYNSGCSDPIFTEFLEKPNVSMRGKYKPGLDVFNSMLEMSADLVPETTGKHTVAVRCSGPFSLEVDGKEVSLSHLR